MSNRTIRVNELVQRELSDILHRHYQSEAVAITITDVIVSPDLHDARVYISVLGDADTAEKKLRWLRTRAVEIRQELARRIVLKFLPKFEYVLDSSVMRGERIAKLIDELGPVAPAAPIEDAPAAKLDV
jgi:ribosome-binding factor A